MDPNDIKKLRKLTSFEALVDYLRDDLDWPIEAEDAEKVAFEYDPKELRIDPLHAVKIESIKQIRPLSDKQPWGVFYIQFENKNLPVVLLRRILHALVPASRRRDPDRKAWKMSDLLFISSQGTENERSISFAHFQELDGKPQLRTFAWDVKETHLYYIKNLNLNALRWPANALDPDAWRRQWSDAFTVAYREVPRTAEMLAKKMAQIASYIREAVELTYSMEHSGGPLHQLHLSLKMDLISDLSEDDFADMYAQTVTYGLFAARATRSGDFKSTDATALIEHTNPFLRELLEQMMNQHTLDLDELGVTELTDLLGKVNMEAILQDFGRQKKGEDPVIHFYETFMRAYDPDQKTKRGEFYTPDPVVSFIVRSVDYLLRTEFDCADGLATTSANAKGFQPVILDPATGTGTFLKYVIEVVWETFYEKNIKLSAADRRVKWNRFVRENILPRLYAFELKMSPYTIAHMKVGLALQEKGFDFEEGERLQIYLTNSLQPAHEVARVDTPALAHEAEKANVIKNNNSVNVIIGNPPYAGFSSNMGNWIQELLNDYRKIDGKKLEEKKIWIQNDYIKFIRFAQHLLTKSGTGIIALITDHSYLDGINFRGLRYSLLSTFDKIYIYDLHGNIKKREIAPDGRPDKNVFDIQQGVAIVFLIKMSLKSKVNLIYHADLWGSREMKYDQLLLGKFENVKFNVIQPTSPFYVFMPRNEFLKSEYEANFRVDNIFEEGSTGVQTSRDSFVLGYEKDDIENRISDFIKGKLPEKDIAEIYDAEDSYFWTAKSAKAKLLTDKNWRESIAGYTYRPFDNRWICYHDSVIHRRKFEVMQQMYNKANLSLCVGRAGQVVGGDEWNIVFCTDKIEDLNLFYRGGNVNFPIYVYQQMDKPSLFDITTSYSEKGRRPNYSSIFLKAIKEKLSTLIFSLDGKGNLHKTFGPEDVFHYMYAVFHSPAYRSRYAEFLKIDFPRLPLTSNVELFRQLCGLGQTLVALHLLEAPVLNKPITKFNSMGDNTVAKGHPKYQDGVVLVNPRQGFEGVPEDVWEFHIGGYQVCEKWLKDRRGRQLSKEDIAHYQKIVNALGETIRLMGEVDKAIESFGGWPMK